MPKAKITHVLSFSSEDPNFPAENLTVGLTYKKWKCKSNGEPQSFVILQLEKAVTICGVDIGNEHSAFVEVLVGRSGAAVDDFQTLVAASSFMSAMESKNSTSTNRVRMFGPEDLAKPACTEKWDRIKVICTQPFNKNIQYGLSFLTVHIPENKDENPVTGNLGRFKMKANDTEDISIGSLFARPKGQDNSPRGVAGQIRDANRTHQSSDQTKPLFGNKLLVGNTNKPSTSPQSKPKERKSPEPSKKMHVPKKPVDDNDKESSSKGKDKIDTALKRKATPIVSPQPKRNKPDAPKLRKPFAKLLDNVVFVISGYQNPGRQTIRDKAISMGAKYKPDWGPGCTHLICAFPNTPKFSQVRGKGFIVSKQWIEDCHADRKRLPWRQYAVDRNDKGEEDSEEEICEDVPIASTSTNQREIKTTFNSARCLDSGSDTDDEIERVKQITLQEAEEKERKEMDSKKAVLKQKEEESQKCLAFVAESSDTDDEIERVKQESLREAEQKESESKETTKKDARKQASRGGSDTDNDELEPRPDTTGLPLPFLPNFYKNKTFYLHDELGLDQKTELNRYITAFDGEVLKDLDCPHIDYLLAENGSDIKRLTAIHPDITAVSPEWVWECNDAEKIVPTEPYKIED